VRNDFLSLGVSFGVWLAVIHVSLNEWCTVRTSFGARPPSFDLLFVRFKSKVVPATFRGKTIFVFTRNEILEPLVLIFLSIRWGLFLF